MTMSKVHSIKRLNTSARESSASSAFSEAPSSTIHGLVAVKNMDESSFDLKSTSIQRTLSQQ